MPFKSFLNTPSELKNFSGQVWWHTLLVLALGREWQVDRSLWVWSQLVLNRVPGQAELHSETLSQNRTKQPPHPNNSHTTKPKPNNENPSLVGQISDPSSISSRTLSTCSNCNCFSRFAIYTTVLSVSPFPVLLCSDSSFPGLRDYISVS